MTPLPSIRGRKNLGSTHTSLPSTPSESDDDVLDVTGVVHEEIHVPSQQDSESLIKSRLRHGAEHVTIGQIGNNLVYANLGGHGILNDIEQGKRDRSILMAKVAKLEKGASQMDKHVSSLESRVRYLLQTSEGYLSIRRRFLDVYKRDVKAMEELKGSKTIREGNRVAHEGDALGDAALFDRDQRTDRSIYRELYGLDYQQVLDFYAACDDQGLCLILNAHATMAAKGKLLSDDLKVAFRSFLTKVEEYWLQPPSKEPNTPLGSAYYTFWKKFNEQAEV